MKKNHSAGAEAADTVQPEDPIEISTEGSENMEASATDVDKQNVEELIDNEVNDETSELREQLIAKEQELSEIGQKYLRLAAEYDNFRRRSQKEKVAIYADSVASVVKEWLPVLDNLDRAAKIVEQTESQEAAKIAEGLALVHKQACEAMEKLGVSEIDCLNEPFDPNLHDAVMHVEDDSVGPSTVVEVLQKGYQRGDLVIRHSIVKVAN
ncbi:MAG: nucleotide exchange factor GrpE [Eubacteriales bacterium]|nr:nucleotide exchange factor GrpE [Eubacteriales bacterium]MDD3198446.1 nucleotide exchange factor GrpE [Eubacteriales bacterium]MDD3503861.1 nucleotide exchange factor GrpE [Eubacteriales bacterium]MDD4682928.1 nucleotide exchange factor GrpE [Eubacteriales bacterium]